MFLVIWRHCLDDSADPVPQFTLMLKSFYMPLFFIVSGYLYKLKPTKDYLYSKSKSLLIPLIIVYFYTFYSKIVVGHFGVDYMYFELSGIWFIQALLFVSIFYHFLNVILLNIEFIKNTHIDYIMFGVCILICFAGLVYAYLFGGTPSVNCGLVSIGFFSFGNIFKNIKNKFEKELKKFTYICLGIILLLITFFVSQKSEAISIPYNTYPNLVVFIVCSVCGSLGVIAISKAIKYSKILCFFGKNTLIMLLTQFGLIAIFRDLLGMVSNNIFHIDELWIVLITFIATIIMEVPVILCINKFIPMFAGKPKYEYK